MVLSYMYVYTRIQEILANFNLAVLVRTARFKSSPNFPAIRYVFLCKQGCPDASDIPRMVSRCTDKLDLDHLLRDLPRYKPWVSPQAWLAWEEFMRFKSSLTEQAVIPWPLPALLSSAIRSAYQRATTTTPPCH